MKFVNDPDKERLLLLREIRFIRRAGMQTDGRLNRRASKIDAMLKRAYNARLRDRISPATELRCRLLLIKMHRALVVRWALFFAGFLTACATLYYFQKLPVLAIPVGTLLITILLNAHIRAIYHHANTVKGIRERGLGVLDLAREA